MDNKKIEVFFRDVYYPVGYEESGKGRPEWFKLKCVFDNLLKTHDPKLCNIHSVVDIMRCDFDYYSQQAVYERSIRSGTDQGAFFELMKIIEPANYDPETIIYIVENDYIHRQNWCEALIEGFEYGDYVTLYDHPDKYSDYPDLQSKLFVTKSCHWRTTPSTTNTFAVKYKTLMEDMDLHKYYAEYGIQGLAHDHTKFLDLGKKVRTIISSIPGYSTHCNNYLSPTIKWDDII